MGAGRGVSTPDLRRPGPDAGRLAPEARSPMVGDQVQLGPKLFPGIGVLPGPATGSHIVNRGTPVAPLGQLQLNIPEKSHPIGRCHGLVTAWRQTDAQSAA
jgi:hypothetical protein